MHSKLLPTTPVSHLYKLLQLKATAINKASEQLDPAQIKHSLTILNKCVGKVITTGIGKSGIVARKIAATLTSMGTLAIYLHPCDALHGDLGVVTEKDVVIMFSNSGETDELLTMIPHLKLRSTPIIGILGNTKSKIASIVDAILDASVDYEDCPLNLVPTNSSLLSLAIGDALVMTSFKMKNITANNFAFNHPAGKLGKRLSLRVNDLMYCNNNYPKLLAEARWTDIILSLVEMNVGAVSIVNKNNGLLGIITDYDLRKSILKTESSQLNILTAQDIMTSNPVVVTPETLAYDALQVMKQQQSQISVLAVVNQKQQSIGLIRLHDILQSGLC